MFTLDEAHTIEEIDAAEDLTPLLVAMDKPLAICRGSMCSRRRALCAQRKQADAARIDRRYSPGKPTRLYLNGQFCGIGRFEGENLKFDAMLLE